MKTYTFFRIGLLLLLLLIFCFACDYDDKESQSLPSGNGLPIDDDDAPGDDDENEGFTYTVYTQDFDEGLTNIATGDFYDPAVSYPPIAVSEKYNHVLTFQMSPMMPPYLGAEAGHGPLVLYNDDMDVLIFSPMDHFFVSLISYNRQGAIYYGIEGEVESVPAGFTHRFILVEGKGINATLEYWGDLLLSSRNKDRTDRYADIGLSYLGYWTDNGAYYYYKTAPFKNEAKTLLAVKADADKKNIPYGYFQIDSWWYFKEEGLLSPGGLIRWEPQPAMFPDGLEAFADELGLPLIAHNRWFAIENDYRDAYQFIDDEQMALPVGREIFDHFMEDALTWGIDTYEQDWLMAQFWGVSHLRNGVDHADQWFANMHDAVNDAGLTMQLCMAGAAHLMSAVDLPAATTIRTSIDYHRDLSKESYWPQFHTVNMLAWAMGVWPFKDNFQSAERHAQAEALMSALSGGMVGPGDKIGAANRDIIMGTCRADGLLLKPDKPITPIDNMFLNHERPFITSTYSDRGGLGRWTYVAAYHLSKNHEQRKFIDKMWSLISYGFQSVSRQFKFPGEVNDWHLSLKEDLGLTGQHVIYNWRTGEAFLAANETALPKFPKLYDFAYLVICPVFENGLALVGEPEKYVTLADKRFTNITLNGDGIEVELAGVPGEEIRVRAYDTTTDQMIEQSVAVGEDGAAVVVLSR